MPDVNARRVLREFVSRYLSQKDAAAALGISEAYLSDLLAKRRNCGPKVLLKLGLRSVVVSR